jgi:hypothetical protein
MADQEIAKLIIRITAEFSDLKKQFEDVKGQLKTTADQAKKSADETTGFFGGISKSLSLIKFDVILDLFQRFRGYATEAYHFAKGIADMSHELEKQSTIAGVDVVTMQKLQYAGHQSGVSNDELTVSLRYLSRAMEQAAHGTGTALPYFKAMGITQEDLQKRNVSLMDVFYKLADSMSKTENAEVRNAAATALMGRTSSDLIIMLSKGSAALKGLGDEAVKMGTVLGDVVVKKGSQAEEAFVRLEQRTNAFKLSLAPLALEFANLIESMLSGLQKFRKDFEGWPDAMKKGIRDLMLVGISREPFLGGLVSNYLQKRMAEIEAAKEAEKKAKEEAPELASHEEAKVVKGGFAYMPTPEELHKQAERVKAQMDLQLGGIQASEAVQKAYVDSIIAMYDDMFEQGILSEKDYIKAKQGLEEGFIEYSISGSKRQIDIAKSGYSQIVSILAGISPEDKAKAAAEMGKELLKLNTELTLKTEKLSQIQTKGATDYTKFIREMTTAEREGYLKVLEDEISKEKEINTLRVGAGEMSALGAAMRELDLAKQLNQAKLVHYQLVLSESPKQADQIKARTEIKNIENALNDIEKRRLVTISETEKTLSRQAELSKSILERRDIATQMERQRLEITEAQFLERNILSEQQRLIIYEDQSKELEKTPGFIKEQSTEWSNIQTQITQARAKIQELNLLLENQTGSLTRALQKGWKEYVDGLKTNFDTIREGLKDNLKTAGDTFEKLLKDVFTGATKGKDWGKNFLKSMADSFAGNEAKQIRQLFENLLFGGKTGKEFGIEGGLTGQLGKLLGIKPGASLLELLGITKAPVGKITGVMSREEIEKAWPEATAKPGFETLAASTKSVIEVFDELIATVRQVNESMGFAPKTPQAEATAAGMPPPEYGTPGAAPEAVFPGAELAVPEGFSSAEVPQKITTAESAKATAGVNQLWNTFTSGLNQATHGVTGFISSLASMLNSIGKLVNPSGSTGAGGGIGGLFSAIFGGSPSSGASFSFEEGGAQKGGKVIGGSGTEDDVPIMAMAGEYVIPKKSVEHYGVGFFEEIRKGNVPFPLGHFSKMTSGGLLGPMGKSLELRPFQGFQEGGQIISVPSETEAGVIARGNEGQRPIINFHMHAQDMESSYAWIKKNRDVLANELTRAMSDNHPFRKGR